MSIQETRKNLKERLREFPSYYANVLSSSHTPIVALVTNHGEVVAGCGVQKPANYIVVYVKDHYRGRGLGKIVLQRTIAAAQSLNLSLLNLAVSTENAAALRLYAKVGFKETASFPVFKFKVLTLPLTFRGRTVYTFLHAVCSLFPETLLLYLLLFVMAVVKIARE